MDSRSANLMIAIEELDGDANHVQSEYDMKDLLGEHYEAYRNELGQPLIDPLALVSVYAKSWSEAWEKLLKDTQTALNFKHVSIEKNNVGEAQRRVEALQDRAERLNQQFEDEIRGKADEVHFEVRNGIHDDYHDAQVLIEHWELPRLKAPHNSGLSVLQHKQQIQRSHLQALLDKLSPPKPTTSISQTTLDRLEKFKKFAR